MVILKQAWEKCVENVRHYDMGVENENWTVGDQVSPNLIVVKRIDRRSSPHEVPDGALADEGPICARHNRRG